MPNNQHNQTRTEPVLAVGTVTRNATISPCGLYRYTLERRWDDDLPSVMFICLNPSTADEHVDDPTVRRCIGFARSLGFGSLVMTNLFAFRSTDPRGLLTASNPIGPENDAWLDRMHQQTDLAISAWGTKGCFLERHRAVVARFRDLQCLGITKDGYPRHPLYIRSDASPQPLGA